MTHEEAILIHRTLAALARGIAWDGAAFEHEEFIEKHAQAIEAERPRPRLTRSTNDVTEGGR